MYMELSPSLKFNGTLTSVNMTSTKNLRFIQDRLLAVSLCNWISGQLKASYFI